MNFLRFISVITVFAMLLCCGAAVAETETAPETETGEPTETAEPLVDPEVLSLLSELTVDAMLKAVNAPARENFRGVVTDFVNGALAVVDRNGDTVTLRIYGVDCPEPDQAGHDDVRAFMNEAFLDKRVSVSVVADDSKGYPVALLFDANGDSLSHLLVATGMAWWDRRNAPQDALLRRLNADAITNGLGLYDDPLALAPWDYRDSRRIEQFDYSLTDDPDPAAPEPAEPPEREEEEPVSISARGTMTESIPRAPVSLPQNAGRDLNANELIMRHQPHIATDDDGQPLGLTASDISNIPYARELGFRDGDIISRVNGIPIRDAGEVMNMVDQFRGVRQFQVEVIRDGRRTTIPITVP